MQGFHVSSQQQIYAGGLMVRYSQWRKASDFGSQYKLIWGSALSHLHVTEHRLYQLDPKNKAILSFDNIQIVHGTSQSQHVTKFIVSIKDLPRLCRVYSQSRYNTVYSIPKPIRQRHNEQRTSMRQNQKRRISHVHRQIQLEWSTTAQESNNAYIRTSTLASMSTNQSTC